MSLGKLSKKRYSYGQADRKGGGGGVNPYSQPDRKKTVFFDDFLLVTKILEQIEGKQSANKDT